MRSITAGQRVINEITRDVQSTRHSVRRRQAILAAAGALALATSAFGQTTQPVYMDQNGTASGLGGGAVTWNSSNTNWATSTAGTTDVAWTAGDVANFSGAGTAFTVTLADHETIGGINFNTLGTTITTTGTVGSPAGALLVSSSNTFALGNPVTLTQLAAARQIIAVPIIGSGDLLLSSNQTNNTSNTIDLVGNMTQFTGNMYMNNGGTATQAQFQLDSPMGNSTGGYGTFYLDNGVGLTSNNQVNSVPGAFGDDSTGTVLASTPNIFTINNPMVLNYKNIASPTNNTIGAPKGPVIGTVQYQKIITYAGNISGSSGLTIGGGNGTTILTGQNTYTGSTVVNVSQGSTSFGFFQLGATNTLPSTTQLIIGNNTGTTPAASVGPTDLDGNSQTIAGLSTGTTGTAALTVGNIYNLQIVNPNYPVTAAGTVSGAGGPGYQMNPNGNAATITISPSTAQSEVFNGDIGDTNTGNGTGTTVAPFSNAAPYSNGNNDGSAYVTPLTNISLVLNGPTGGGNNKLTLAPVDTYTASSGTLTGVPGDEYSGTTTINANSTLIFGRGFDKQAPASYTGGPGVGIPGSNFTITGSGDVIVNSGGQLASLSSSSGFDIGGAEGTIRLRSGSSFLPGEGLMSTASKTTQGFAGNTVTLSPNNIGTLQTGSIEFDSGASMTFSIFNASSFDYAFLYGSLNLDDSNADHTINVDLASGGVLSPGNYNLISAGSIAGPLSAYVLNTSSIPTSITSQDILSLGFYTNPNTGVQSLQLQVTGPDFQWDPTGQGHSNFGGSVVPIVQEGAGTWTDGASPFYNQIPHTEVTWSNSDTNEVIIGDDGTQAGGAITLGSNIVVAGGIEFGSIMTGANYSIINSSGNSYTLTIGGANVANNTPGGIQVENSAATSTTPSAEIDVPVILSASQTWSITSGQFLNVTGSVTENDSTPSYTLTVTGGGVLDLSGNNGSIGTLAVNSNSIVLLGSTTAIGNAAVNLNGGGVEFSVNGSPTNAITIGPLGGAIGATTGFSVVYSPNINSANGFEAIGTGTTTFQGSVSVGTLQVAAASTTSSGTTLGTIHFSGNVTDTGNLSVTGGNVYFDAVTKITGSSSFTAGNSYFDNPNAATTPNTFTGGITIAGGTVYAQSSNALGNAVITFPGAPAGGLDIAGAATLSNPLNGTGSGATAGGNSFGDTVFIDAGHAFTLTGATEGTGDLRWYMDPNTTGATPSITLDEASQRPGGGAQYFNIPNLTVVLPVDSNVNTGAAMGLSTQAFMVNTTVEVDVPVAVSGDWRGENNPGFTLTKTGTGTIALTGSAGSGFNGNLNVNQGEVEVTSTTGLGGTAAAIINVNIAANGVFGADYSGSRAGGAYTLAAGSTLRRDGSIYTETFTGTTGAIATAGSFNGEADISAVSATDIITIAGNATIDDANIEGANGVVLNSSGTFTLANPVVVNSGVVLTLEDDDPQFNPSSPATGGYTNNSLLGFRGPTAMVTTTTPAVTSNAYDDITLQAGATITQTGPGEVRFGRFNSQGIAIIGQGTPGHESVLQLGADAYMTDNNATANEINTLLVVNGSGSAGLRIEAAMSATYEDPNSPNANLAATEGTTGLFGVNTTITNTGPSITGYSVIGNAFTILSPNRLLGLSTPYNNGTTTITPSGTLTLAANDAGNATGLINAGPAAASAVSLALDNTAGSGGNHIYQIDPGLNGATFANFAGLTLERSNAGGAAVTAQLLGTTKVPTLAITGGAKMDITTQALAVDSAAPAPTAAIAGYLASAYDSGNWDGPGIGSSSISSQLGTSIGYAENDLLPTPFTSFGGQTVDNNAVLVKYTWLGDLNLDGVVTSADFAMMGDGQNGWIGGDLNYDHVVNADDWALFMLGNAAFDASGQQQLNSVVPEPATMSLLAIGAGAMLRRKRRV